MVDPHRVGDELAYFPGEVNLLRAQVIIINKIDSARREDLQQLRKNIKEANPTAVLIEANSSLLVDRPELIQGARVLVIEDGPTLTHGGMKYGAGTLAAQRYGASEIIDPRPWLQGSLKTTFETYPETGPLLPAMGYDQQQRSDLESTINAVPCDLVIIGTPIDLGRVINIQNPQ